MERMFPTSKTMYDITNIKPDLTITFQQLPSWNDFLATARHFGAAAGLMKKWRKAGAKQAIDAVRRAGGSIATWEEYGATDNGRMRKIKHELIKPYFFTQPVTLVLAYWRPDNRRYDNFNPLVKPVVDGFIDAGLMEDDNNKFIVQYGVDFKGVDKTLKLSPEAAAQRKIDRRVKGKSLLTYSRFDFNFYVLR